MTGASGPADRPGPSADAIAHGFPHLETVHAALTALYRRVSYDMITTFAASVLPQEVAIDQDTDIYLGTQRVAHSVVAHMRLPQARMIVAFRDMTHAGSVELESGPEYFVELNSRFKTDRRDIGACLAHEVAHVYLHRLGLAFRGTRDNEILTDTTAAYLGAGWLLLDAYREESTVRGDRMVRTASKLGYLTPEEFGYVLAKRALAFNDDIEPWLSSVRARDAYRAGLALARQEARRPPLAGAGWAERRGYAADRRRMRHLHRRTGKPLPAVRSGDYAFEGGSPLLVSFPCPTCRQRLRLPVRGEVRARCTLCRSELDCDT